MPRFFRTPGRRACSTRTIVEDTRRRTRRRSSPRRGTTYGFGERHGGRFSNGANIAAAMLMLPRRRRSLAVPLAATPMVPLAAMPPSGRSYRGSASCILSGASGPDHSAGQFAASGDRSSADAGAPTSIRRKPCRQGTALTPSGRQPDAASGFANRARLKRLSDHSGMLSCFFHGPLGLLVPQHRERAGDRAGASNAA